MDGISVALAPGMIFSVGGVLAKCWRPPVVWLPWVIAAIFIGAGALWDSVSRGGRIDFIMIGLACYELIMGLTEEPSSDPPVPANPLGA